MNTPTSVLVAPIAVVAVTFLAPVAAVAVIAQLALMVVLLDPVTEQVTPAPDTVTAVAPLRSTPERVSGTVVPRTAAVGATESNCPVTVNVVVAVPPGVVTVTVLAVIAAPVPMVKVVVMEVPAGFTVNVPGVTPPPFTLRVVPVVVKLAPVIVTGTTMF